MVGSSIQLEEIFLLAFVLVITRVLTNIDLMETFNLDTLTLFKYKIDDQNKGKDQVFNPLLPQKCIVWVCIWICCSLIDNRIFSINNLILAYWCFLITDCCFLRYFKFHKNRNNINWNDFVSRLGSTSSHMQ